MQCYTELIPPTAVTHAASLPFLGAATNNLVIAKPSLLQIFDIKTPPNGTPKLALVGEYTLSGTVTSLAAVQTINTKSGGSALLLAFKDAKLSLVEWDPENHRINTISIHYYESEDIIQQPFGPSLKDCETILTVDPSSRCALLKFGARQLAVLPFRQAGDELGEEGEENGLDTDLGAGSARKGSTAMDVAGETHQTPYKPSFVLSLTSADPSLTHPIHLTSLHGYMKPALGTLFAVQQPSNALLDERRDCLGYTVLTLELDEGKIQRQVNITKLPSDLFKVVALPQPIGGALLIGTNELIHVDQGAKTHAVAVNEFAKQASNFSMVDQSNLCLKLEGCEVDVLDSGDVIIVLHDGSLVAVNFKLVGMSVGGLTVTKISPDLGGASRVCPPSCVAALDEHKLFVGSEDGNSTLLSWSGDAPAVSRKRSHAQMAGRDETAVDEEDVDDMDDDDLYAPAAETAKRRKSSAINDGAHSASSFTFERCDELRSLGPVNNICFGKSPKTGKSKLELVAGIGRGTSSQLAFLSREIVPDAAQTWHHTGLKDVWAVRAAKSAQETSDLPQSLLFAYNGEETKAYHVKSSVDDEFHISSLANPEVLVEKFGSEWEGEGETLFVGTLANNTRIVQCRPHEMRIYDHDLALSQIIPMLDEETDAELKIITTDFLDPYMLALRDDSSVQVLKVDKSGDVEALEVEGEIKERKRISACLYAGEITGGEPAVIMLNADSGLQVFSLPDLKPVYAVPVLPSLPPILSPDAPVRRGARATLTEVLLTDLGPADVKQPYLILRTAEDSLILYEPFHYDQDNSSPRPGFANLKFRKVPNTYTPKFDPELDVEEGSKPARLSSIQVNGGHAVYVPGSSPSLILKESTSVPRILGIRTDHVQALASLRSLPGQADRIALIDKTGKLSSHSLPDNSWFGLGWQVQTVDIFGGSAGPGGGEEVRHVAYHEDRGVYVVATCRYVDFYFAAEDGRHDKQDGMFTFTLFPCSKSSSMGAPRLLGAPTHPPRPPRPPPPRITSIYVCPLSLPWSDVYS
jgi:cleavage and polyadenylation specificity factor subunit 1